MIRSHLLLALSLVSACGGSGSADLADLDLTKPITPLPGLPESGREIMFADLLNDIRISNGVDTVAYDANLGLAAQAHADDMLAQDYFRHISKDGSTLGDRATAAGYIWVALAENIAQGQTSQTDVLAAWTGSPGHHANNISPAYDDFGLGLAGSGSDTRWVLVLGRN